MPRNAKKLHAGGKIRPHKEREFQAYLVWKSLPPAFLGKRKELLQGFGITDPIALEVISIESQTDFAKKFGIKDLGTLTDWNRRIEKGNLKKDYMKRWAAGKLPNALDALYRRILKFGKGSDFKVWVQYVDNWVPPDKRTEPEGSALKLKQKVSELYAENLRLKMELAKKG